MAQAPQGKLKKQLRGSTKTRSSGAVARTKPRKKASKPNSKRKRKTTRKTGLGEVNDKLIYVLSHPLRIRMLVSLNEEGEGSSSDLAARLHAETKHVAYHMKVLKEQGFAEFVRWEAKGSAAKAIYKAIRKAEFPQEVWEKLPPAAKSSVIVGLFLTSHADTETAVLTGAFELHPESVAAWTTMELGDRNWARLRSVLERALEEALEIGEEENENHEAGESDDRLNISLSIFAFPLLEISSKAVDRPTRFLRHEGATATG